MKKVVKKIVSILVICIIVLFGAVVSDILYVGHISDVDHIYFSNFTKLHGLYVLTSSMEAGHNDWANEYDNHFSAGDLVIIKKVESADKINVGDVITFKKREGEPPIIHRVIAKEKVKGHYEFLTRGDANNTPDDESVHEDKVVGKYVCKIPKLGLFVQNTEGFITGNSFLVQIIVAIIILAIVAYIFYCVINWIRRGK